MIWCNSIHGDGKRDLRIPSTFLTLRISENFCPITFNKLSHQRKIAKSSTFLRSNNRQRSIFSRLDDTWVLVTELWSFWFQTRFSAGSHMRYKLNQCAKHSPNFGLICVGGRHITGTVNTGRKEVRPLQPADHPLGWVLPWQAPKVGAWSTGFLRDPGDFRTHDPVTFESPRYISWVSVNSHRYMSIAIDIDNFLYLCIVRSMSSLFRGW